MAECVNGGEVHCGYCWPGGKHWSRRTKMGESVQCHSTRVCTEWISQYFLQTAWLNYLILFPWSLILSLAGVSETWLMAYHRDPRTPQCYAGGGDDDRACQVKGMSVDRTLYKRVRWEERCRLGCKCSVGRLRPVCAGLRFTELQTCE